MSRAVADHSRAEQVGQVSQALRGPLAHDALAAAAVAPAAAGPSAPLPAAAQLAGAQLADAKPVRARELDCLAQAVYFEARGESPRGQAAVATVIMNRVKNPKFPKTVCGVVYQGASHRNGCQFSFACDGQAERVVEQTAWERARQVAARALSGAVLRDVGSATHFHTTAVDPEWGSRMLRVAQVGLHVFYRFNPHAPPPAIDDADDPPVFASRPAAQPQLRLAVALVAPSAEAVRPADAAPVASEAKPAPKAEASAPGPIARTDAPAPPKAAAAAS